MIFEVLWPRAGGVPECSYSVPGTSGAWIGDAPHRGDEVRHEATPLLRPVDADKAHQLEHALLQSRAAQAGRMNTDSGRQLRADGHAGVQRGHRVLKYHGKQ